MPVITRDQARIDYDVTGPRGAPVVLLSNALGTTRDLWARQVPAWATDFRIVRYDTRGQGRSIAGDEPWTLETLGTDALAVLDAVGAERAHVCGVSLGGLTALWLGVHAPDRVDRLVLANTAARLGTREMWSGRIALVRAGRLDDIVDQAPLRWFTSSFCARDPETVAAFQASTRACDVEGYLGACAVLRDADLSADLHLITAPTLVVAGSQDPVTTVDDARAIVEGVAGARLLTLDAAHFSLVESSLEFNAAVRAFLDA